MAMTAILEEFRRMVHDPLQQAYEEPATGYAPDDARKTWKLDHDVIYGIPGPAGDFHAYVAGSEVAAADYTLDQERGIITFNTAPTTGQTLLFIYLYSDFTDAWLQQQLNRFLVYLSEGAGGGLSGFPMQTIDDNWRIWVCKYPFIDSTGILFYDSSGTTITPTTYDYINGRFEFGTSHSGGAYIKGRAYKAKEAAVEVWKIRATQAEDISMKIGAGVGEDIQVKDKYDRAFCLKQAALYKRSKSIGATRA